MSTKGCGPIEAIFRRSRPSPARSPITGVFPTVPRPARYCGATRSPSSHLAAASTVAHNALSVKLKLEEHKQQAVSLPADAQERLTRLETRLAEMSEEQRQLRSELEWQGKLLQQSSEK